MSINKNFVVKNGLEVNTDLIVADATTNSVGIATTSPKYTLHVNGEIGATDVYVSGIATFASKLNIGTGGTIFAIENNNIGVGTILPAYPLHVVGVGTVLYVDGDIKITGDLNADDVILDQANINSLIVGTSTATVLNVTGLTTTQNLYVSGVSTYNNYIDVNADVDISNNLNVVGVATIANINITGISSLATAYINTSIITNLTSSGVSTLGNVEISSGIITASSGIVTYYGDGRYLNLGNNSSTGIGIGTTGGIVGYGITFLDLKGAGVSTTFYNSNVGIATIFFEGGGSGTIGIGSTFPTISVRNGDLFYHINYGRTFVYYDEVTLGIGSTSVWVDASPFNVGLLTIDDLSVSKLSVSTNVNVVGVVTASAFYGDGANLTNTGSSLSAASGTQRIVVTGQTSGTMTASATDADLTFNATTNTLSVPQSVVGSAVTINSSGVNVTGVTTSTSVIVGSAVTINSSGVNATSGIVTASSFLDSAGNLRSIPQNERTSSYNLAASDNGKHISITTGGITVLSGTFSIGDTVAIYNNSSSNQTITQGSGVTLRQAGTGNTGNRTLAQYGICTILCVASNTFVISGTGIS